MNVDEAGRRCLGHSQHSTLRASWSCPQSVCPGSGMTLFLAEDGMLAMYITVVESCAAQLDMRPWADIFRLTAFLSLFVCFWRTLVHQCHGCTQFVRRSLLTIERILFSSQQRVFGKPQGLYIVSPSSSNLFSIEFAPGACS